jgi:formylglycine-generating enzyme required for sulfatase activity
MLHALEHEELSREDHPQLEGSLSIFTALEHEQMHHETLLYMLHRIDPARKRRPDGYAPEPGGAAPPADEVTIPAGRAALGASRGEGGFGWDNEFDGHAVEVAEFRVDRYNVTNERFLEFVESGAYDDPQFWTPEQFAWKREAGLRHPLFWEREGDRWMWRGMFDRIPLPESWPVYVTHAEAEAYARWRGKRLMTKRSFIAPHTGRHSSRSAPTRGETSIPTDGTATSDSTAGTRGPSAAILQAQAPGASTTWWGTDGSGPPRCSVPLPASGPWPPTRSTRQISSTASTT